MKKVFKGLSVLVASTALCAGIATASACSGGYNGTYYGEYHYMSQYGVYGMVVEVTVENNIITKVEDITNTDLEKQSGKVKNEAGELVEQASGVTWVVVSDSWTNKDVWNENAAWLLQQYEGMSVTDIKNTKVFIQSSGCPYNLVDKNNNPRNPQLAESGLVITGASQGSGRCLLAIQDALSK